jgi:mannose-6-phosphate isomerase-like protein (cupin superfamily)
VKTVNYNVMLNTENHKYVHKDWGYELWIANSEKYCGKLLFIQKEKQLSWHYHKIKDEVMYVQEGKIKIYYSQDNDYSKAESKILEVGDSFHIPTGLIHSILALKESQVFEFSTQHFDEDSIRLQTF